MDWAILTMGAMFAMLILIGILGIALLVVIRRTDRLQERYQEVHDLAQKIFEQRTSDIRQERSSQ